MAHCVLSAVILCFVALAQSAIADTVIRIIGDRTPVVPNNSSGAATGEPLSSSVRGSTIIRIIGDKQSTVQKPAGGQDAEPEPDRSPSVIKETCVSGDKVETVKNMAPDQMDELQLTQRLDSLTAEVARKAAEKAERHRMAQGEDERENAAELQAAIEQEQEQLAAASAKKPRKGGKKHIRKRN